MEQKNADRLKKALFGRQNQDDYSAALSGSGNVLPIRTMIEKLMTLDDADWSLYAWSRDPLEGKFTRKQKLSYAEKAMACGREEAVLLQQDFHTGDPGRLAEAMKLQVAAPDTPNGGGHVIFAQYVEPDQVTIFMDSVKKAEDVIEKEGLAEYLGVIDVFGLLLAHEIFHAVEYRKEDTIYTKTEKVELWKKPFSNRSRLVCLGEIAGMKFAASLLGLSYSPYLMDVLFMYGYHQEAATALYEEIMEIAGKDGGKGIE